MTHHEQPTDIPDRKRELRQLARSRAASLTAADRQRLSLRVVDHLLERPEWQNARRILGYLALKDELDLSTALESALRAGKTVALPRYVRDQGNYCAALVTESFAALPLGAFGIPEPGAGAPVLPLNQLDFILVPGVAFDASGGRLGRGKGFYDRLLANVNNATCIKCGIAADEQIVTGIPAEAHDVPMNFILTPTRWLVPRPGPD